MKARQTASSLNSLYAVGPSDQVLLIERGPDGFWGWWRAPGGARTVSVDTSNDGGLDVFTIGGDDAVYHRWQDKPFDVWHPWESLGGAVESLSAANAPTGGLAVFAIALDGCPAATRRGPRASGASGSDGLEVFAVGLDDEVYHTWCESVGWPWQEWTLLDYETSPLRVAASGLPRRVS